MSGLAYHLARPSQVDRSPTEDYSLRMAIPTFESNGLLPTGIHECSLEEINSQFTWNNHRTGLFSNFRRFLDSELKPQFPYPIFFDGSFVTDKELPDDTDVVLDLSNAPDDQKWQALTFLQAHQERIMQTYRVHFWINFPGSNDFAAFFQYVGVKTASAKGLNPLHLKGILKVA
ncbi:MAG: hypothetical protein IPN98_03870 [Propionivibrio sp.]|nr:hypothetical protein [Propionivibrio sp.]